METRLPATEREAVQQCFRHKYADEQFYELAETLLWRNQAVVNLLDRINGFAEGLNTSQRTFATVAALDLQVPNGGLLQFFWNCPGWVDDVPVSLRTVGLLTLADVFERSSTELMAHMGTYSEFRKCESMQSYSECASRFTFDEFDAAYYAHKDEVYLKGTAFVAQHLSDFVADHVSIQECISNSQSGV